MTDIPTLLEDFAKSLRKQLKPIDEILNPKAQNNNKKTLQKNLEKQEEQEEEIETINQIPRTNVAVFWDYENFPIPNGTSDELFFEALFPSGSEERYILKRVYAKPEEIKTKLDVIKNYGFTFKEGLLSGKENEIDHVLMTDCVEYCTESTESLLVVLMAGDVDYLALIEKLVERGHEVRIVCNDKSKVKIPLQKIIPLIIDRTWINDRIESLNRQLYNLTSMTNYLLSEREDQTQNFDELYEEIEDYYVKELQRGLKGLFKLMIEHPAFEGQYSISNEFIQKLEIEGENDINNLNQAEKLSRRQLVEYRLGYEEDYENWLKLWEEKKKYEPDREKQRTWLNELYTSVNLPHVRNYVQRELIKILLIEQSEKNYNKEILFRNTRINDYVNKIQQREMQIKNNYPCKYCKKTFKTGGSLHQHTKAVHNKKRPSNLCPICGKKLQDKNGLENHRRQAHTEHDKPLPEECNTCYMRFETVEALKNHTRMKHNK